MAKNENEKLNEFINKFIEQVFKDLKLENVSAETEKALREMIKDRVEKRLMALIINSIPDQEFDKVIDRLDKKGITEDEEVEALSEAVLKIPDFAGKFRDALKELHKELTEDAEELRKYTGEG